MTTNSSAAVACAASSVIGDARELLDCEFQLLAGKRPAGFLAGVVVCPTSYSGNYPGNIQGGVVCPTHMLSLVPLPVSDDLKTLYFHSDATHANWNYD